MYWIASSVRKSARDASTYIYEPQHMLIADVYAVVDLYGTCAGATITRNTGMYEGQRAVRHRESVSRPNHNRLNEIKAAPCKLELGSTFSSFCEFVPVGNIR